MHKLVSVALLVFVSWSTPAVSSRSGVPCYQSIFSFGDSFADTGNNPVVFEWYSIFDPVTRPPYGTSFFGHHTGRNGDGRLIIDFIAENLGLPYVPPNLAHNGSFRRGANFAVGAATAVDAGFFHERGIPSATSKFPLNTSLGVQLEWFESLKPSLYRTTRECKKFFGRSLFFVGEFGVNDYHMSFQQRTVQEVRSLVPDVVASISKAIERLITMHGARSLVVPGVIPSGCSPPILTRFADASPPSAYDSRTGCLKAYNELGLHHNSLLQAELAKLQAKHWNARIIYADFFGPIMDMVESPHKFGFEQDVLMVCCGGAGRYRLNSTVPCGDAAATTCPDPSARLYWDGVHLTEAANRHIANIWLGSITSATRVSSSKCAKWPCRPTG
ncbi:GDSL esterase/lipase At5g45910-like [Triticum dicoccoides]|uniref:GDSL esterase/lipase At5g45910-like n=1 Tax=Triticum dicoccoides TaxID=85692 RepID=UPI001891E994|nr:GDSL esterase/lipase At5g45910-like [Triticum dicoccoides]